MILYVNGFDDLWIGRIHLLNSGKTMSGSNFVSKLNRYFGKSNNFLCNFQRGLKENKIQSCDKLILGYLNINLVRNNLQALTYIIDNNIELFLII